MSKVARKIDSKQAAACDLSRRNVRARACAQSATAPARMTHLLLELECTQLHDAAELKQAWR